MSHRCGSTAEPTESVAVAIRISYTLTEILSTFAYVIVCMGEKPNAFLTDERRAVLADDYDGSESVKRTHKSRIRERARSAVDELIEVAQSKEIENADVFEPAKIGTLLFWIMHDWSQTPTGTTDGEESDGETPFAPKELDYPDEYEQYRKEVHSEVAQEIMKIDHPERGRFDD